MQQKVQAESRQMDSRLSHLQLQQTGSRARVRASSLPATAFNKVSKTQTVSKTLPSLRETQQGRGGQGQDSQESSSNCVGVDVAAAMPV